MSRTEKNKIEYFIALINEFAKRHSISDTQAYHYIKSYNGIGFIEDNYDIMHTLDFNDVIEGLNNYCHRLGGNLI